MPPNHRLDDLDEIIRVVGLVLVGGFCAVGATGRERRERDLARVTRVAEVAQLRRRLENLVSQVLRHSGGHLGDDVALLLAELRA